MPIFYTKLCTIYPHFTPLLKYASLNKFKDYVFWNFSKIHFSLLMQIFSIPTEIMRIRNHARNECETKLFWCIFSTGILFSRLSSFYSPYVIKKWWKKYILVHFLKTNSTSQFLVKVLNLHQKNKPTFWDFSVFIQFCLIYTKSSQKYIEIYTSKLLENSADEICVLMEYSSLHWAIINYIKL